MRMSNTDKIMKYDVELLMNKFSIPDFECALVQLFLENKKIDSVKNLLVKEFLKESEETRSIKAYFSQGDFNLDLKEVERAFELLIPKADREVNGAFYTPNYIVDYIINKTISSGYKICDPACGSGAFLKSAAKKMSSISNKSITDVIQEDIFGCDILDYNVRRTKLILTLLALENGEDNKNIKFNIINEDSLRIDWREHFPDIITSDESDILFNKEPVNSGFDAVIGNPPYVRIQDLKKGSKDLLLKKWNTVNGGNFNIYFAFFELGMKITNKRGKLGYIVPKNYFTSFAAEKLRMWLQSHKFLEDIVDFTHLRIFQDATTYTCITILSKDNNDVFTYKAIDNHENLYKLNNIDSDEIHLKDLAAKKWRLLKKDDVRNIRRLETFGKPLGMIADIHSGIATLKDKFYFVEGDEIEDGYFIKHSNGQKYFIEKDITRKVIKISDVANDDEIKASKLRVIFPYKESVYGTKIIFEDELKSKFPKCYAYLLSIKNELSTRDKGKKVYPAWYAYGRGQGFNVRGKKLLTPTFSKRPKFMLDKDGYRLFCNGYAIINSELELEILQKILNSEIMNYYINKTSVHIEGGFPCFQKNFIESFHIPIFSKEELNYLRIEKNEKQINQFLMKKYALDSKPFM